MSPPNFVQLRAKYRQHSCNTSNQYLIRQASKLHIPKAVQQKKLQMIRCPADFVDCLHQWSASGLMESIKKTVSHDSTASALLPPRYRWLKDCTPSQYQRLRGQHKKNSARSLHQVFYSRLCSGRPCSVLRHRFGQGYCFFIFRGIESVV